MSEVFNYCHIAELTDRGCKRAENEDWMAHFESPNGLVAVVCDGMGGHVGGKTASHTAVEAIQQFMMRERGGTPFELIVEAINVACAAILNKATQQPELTGMGATCVMLIVRDGKVYIGSVGDSRVYLIRNRKIKQLTTDQSYVQMLLDAGSITPEQAEHHPRKNEITNALGLKGMQPATVLPEAITPEAGDCFLLCSDGLSGMVSDDEICKVVSRQSDKTQQERVEELVLRAKRNGGLDNITCQIVEFSVAPNVTEDMPWWRKNQRILIGVVAVVVSLIAAVLWFSHSNKSSSDELQHSEEVQNLIATVDSVYELKGTLYEDKKEFLNLTEDKDFGGVKLQTKGGPLQYGDTTIIIKQFSIDSLEVTPKSGINIEYLNSDSTEIVLSFKNKKDFGDETEVTVTLRGKEKSYMFILPVQTKTAKQRVFDDNNKKKEKSIWEKDYSKELKKPKSEEDFNNEYSKGATGGNNNPEQQVVEQQNVKTDYNIIIPENATNYKITLHGVNGTNTDTDYYFSGYTFKIVDGDNGWYVVKNNGRECIITIKNTSRFSIPNQDATISVPTQDPKSPITLIIIKGGNA